MKKIIIAFDNSNLSNGSLDFVCQLNEAEPVLATAVFIPQIDYANLMNYGGAVGILAGPEYIQLPEKELPEEVLANIRHFENVCQKNGILYRVHKDFYDFPVTELKRESRFADLAIISGELFYKGVIEANQFEYLKDVLRVSECPVLILPEKHEFPDNNIVAYDGSEESVYAMKQFAYIFPELTKNPTLFVYAEDVEERDLPSKAYIEELATQHFENLTFYKLEANPRRYFRSWMADKNGSILVSGSFSRSSLSQVFKKSFVADIIKDHRLPVFIAHK